LGCYRDSDHIWAEFETNAQAWSWIDRHYFPGDEERQHQIRTAFHRKYFE
jgi:hypothetical protein